MARSRPTRRPVLSAEEALALHHDALVIDSQQPPATNGFLFNDNMRAALREYHAQGMTQSQAFGRLAAMAAREIQTSEEARREYVDFWDASGVDVACGTYAGPGPIGSAFEDAVTSIAQARSIVDALEDRMLLVLEAADIERGAARGQARPHHRFPEHHPVQRPAGPHRVCFTTWGSACAS